MGERGGSSGHVSGSSRAGQDRASILVEGQRVVQKRTIEAGYTFRYPTIDGAMDDLVEITI
ncbi:DUF1731 domain-containing protein [Jannaschia aquimarina]|uniref:DUF1731 domain-containing protein n=1 Tax=Jannaschia aquimarina TaxID=935700 RepID=A0A0D1DA19_9RHOB|nr:DUF1731 domain-containing protein [Jannaschia aquimarina]KIT16738.1 hypothetical protein jaqu_15260 [Jannaschia aquimarina]SNS53544.1 hypothetical protein SAMN05421775_101352 [Jannaschia aquimarina]